MSIYLKKVTLVFLLISFLGCTNRLIDKPIKQIHVNINKEPSNFPYSQCFEEPDYIPLETNSNSLISSIDKVVFYESKFYILDRDQKQIFMFSSEGKFLNKIFSLGKGPGEYLSLNDINIYMNKLYVLSRDSKKILVCDLIGNYINEIKLEFYYSRFQLESENIAILYSNFSSNGQNTNFTRVSLENGKTLDTHYNYPSFLGGTGYGTSVFSKYNDTIYCTIPYDYGIYKITSKGLKQAYNIIFKQYQMLSESDKETVLDLDNRLGKIIYKIDPLIVMQDILIFNVGHWGYKRTIFYSNNKVSHGIFSWPDSPLLVSNFFVGQYDEHIISYAEATSIFSGLKYGSEDYKSMLKELPFINTIKRSDNPILLTIKIKR